MQPFMRSRPSLRLGALLAAGALLASAPVVAQDPAGFPVTDAISGVSVTLPAPYETQEQAVPGTAITIRYYLAVDGETATSFSVFEVTEADGGYDLDGGVQGSADGTGGTLVSSVPIVHQGHEGRDFEVSVTDQASGVAGLVLSRLLWTGTDVVQLQAVAATPSGPRSRRCSRASSRPSTWAPRPSHRRVPAACRSRATPRCREPPTGPAPRPWWRPGAEGGTRRRVRRDRTRARRPPR